MTTPLGKYKLVKLIASGGMAEVYLARQAGAAGFEKLVCLKRILPHLARDKQFVEMFLNEARLAARLDHPNIVSIFDLGEANGNYFIAMEFIDGPSLRAIHKLAAERGEHLPIPEICKIVSMAAGGLQYAHDLTDTNGKPLGLVHRDISPDNVLVHRNGSAKVVDFGIAKAANSSSQTRTGTLKGKVAYMPPEQLRGEGLDRRTDVFALGVVLYELLAGKRPWEGTSEVALIGKIMTEDPQPLGELRPDAPRELIDIVDKALAKDRAQRYQSCHELQADLESLVVGMGQTITPSRVSDFVKAYSAPPQSAASLAEQSSAEIQQIENEMNGTGAAPALVKGRGQGVAGRDSRTTVMPPPVAPSAGRGALYGVLAFLVIAVGGGAGGYWFFFHQDEPSQAPVQVERAAVVDPPAPKPAEPAPKPAETPAPVAPPEKPAEAKPPEPKPRPRRVAQVEPPPAPVVIVKEPPKPVVVPEQPKQTVIAKGELVLLVRPWAKVEVDGREVGVTPLNEPLMLAAGDHKVRLINPDLQKDVVRTVHITASEKEVLKEILDE
ncbi:MAG: protein kinase [Myxococcales bacterium]|nr:protein kinase [Myxococcales bacterium]